MSIKPITMGLDSIVQSEPETGKSVAFIIGALQLINNSINHCQALILVPSDESAQKIHKLILEIGEYLEITCEICARELETNEKNPKLETSSQFLVGTPSRILDMISRNNLITEHLKIISLFEADYMISKGFKDHIEDLFRILGDNVQRCLFSVTMPPDVLKLSTDFMRNPIRIVGRRAELTLEGISQYYVSYEKEEWKFETLAELLGNFDFPLIIIYANNSKKFEELSQKINDELKIASAYIDRSLDHRKRKEIIKNFRTGFTRVLFSSDLFTRFLGVNVSNLVINYDLPNNFEQYLDRIGRSGCFGRKGVCINFITQRDLKFLEDLKQYFNTIIEELPIDLSDIF